jgi:hypothetical protein
MNLTNCCELPLAQAVAGIIPLTQRLDEPWTHFFW